MDHSNKVNVADFSDSATDEMKGSSSKRTVSNDGFGALMKNSGVPIEEVFREQEHITNDKSTIWRLYPFKTPNGPFFKIMFPSGNLFVDVVRSRQYILAKDLWTRRFKDTVEREFEEVEVLRKLSLEFNLPLDMLLTYSTVHSLMRELVEEKSYMLLLWTIFPRLLLLHPDFIPPQSLDHMQMNGIGPLNTNTTTPTANNTMKRQNDPLIDIGYCAIDVHRMYQHGRRATTAADLTYLRQFPPPPILYNNRTSIHWEFYCRELLESIERLGGSLLDQVIELENTDCPLPGGVLYSDYGLEIETARQAAKAFCSSRVIVVYDHADGKVLIKDVTLSGPRIAHPHCTTYYRIAASPSSDMVGQDAVQERLRAITDSELAYLKRLRWQDRRPALLVAARCRNGTYFHVLKLIARFL